MTHASQISIGLIGAGNMAYSLLSGLIQQGHTPQQLWIADPNAERCGQLAARWSVQVAADNIDLVKQVDLVILAVKPAQLAQVCQQISAGIGKHSLIVSIAAGIDCAALTGWLGPAVTLVRAMPNTPAQVQKGVTGLFAPKPLAEPYTHWVGYLFDAVGSHLWLDDEQLMHAVTAVSGSGPAYCFYIIEQLLCGAQQLGLNEAQARQLLIDTFAGSTALLRHSDLSPAQLRQQVCSPGGTTERALQALQHHSVDQGLIAALHSAHQRSRELAASSQPPQSDA